MKPIIIIGAARSGTTFLARSALSKANAVCYWGEPNYVWMHGHAYQRHDVLSARDATPSVQRYIRARFEKKLLDHGGECIIEKTPSNCLRIPFIREIFPEARFVHLIRDGRDVVRSAVKEWRGIGHDAHDSKELRQGSGTARVGKGMKAYLRLRERVHDIRDVVELPSYLPRLSNFIRRNICNSGDFLWGPRFPGMKEFRLSHSLEETCAEQWRWQVDCALDGLGDLPPESVYNMRFESLMADPEPSLCELLDWLGIAMESEVLDSIVKSVARNSSQQQEDPLYWIGEDVRPAVEQILKPVLLRIGYSG